MSDTPLRYPREALRDWWQQKNHGKPPSEEEFHPLGELADTLFFASLAKEEGQPTLARIVYHEQGAQGLKTVQEHDSHDSSHGPILAWDVIPIEPIQFSVKALVKIAPAANLERTAVVVGSHNGQLYIQGLARRIKRTDGGDVPVFSAPEPGFIIWIQAGKEIFRYERGYSVSSKQKIPLWDALDKEGIIKSTLEETCKSLMRDLPSTAFSRPAWDISSTVFDLINTMVMTRHGGIIAILATQNSEKGSAYPLSRAHRTLLNAKLREYASARHEAFELAWKQPIEGYEDPYRTQEELMARSAEEDAKNALDSTIENIGRLTAVDNALLIGPDLEILGAGFPIPTPREGAPEVYEAQSLQGTPGALYNISQHGSRHRAAAWFAHQNQGGLVFIVSHDGPLRCMLRPSAQQEMVLLWNLRLDEF
jgi:sensor domain DACNV-containing protein